MGDSPSSDSDESMEAAEVSLGIYQKKFYSNKR